MNIKTLGLKHVLRLILLFLLLPVLTGPEAVYAQSRQEIQFDRISIEQGLSQATINCIHQDRQGFMWFGTQDGLNKYDGYTFTVYNHDPETSAGLSDGIVWSIFEDKLGTFWLGTSGGLNRFDPATETFTHYKHRPGDPKSLSHNDIRPVFVDSGGTLWVGTYGGGLNKFDPDTETFTRYQHRPGDPTSLSDNNILSFFEDSGGNLWTGTLDGGLNRFDPVSGAFTPYRRQPGNPRSLCSNSVYLITEDKKGNLWVGSTGGLTKFDRKTQTFTRYQHRPGNPNSLSHNDVRAVIEDARGALWIGTLDGLNHFDPATGAFTTFRHRADDPRSLSGNAVMSAFTDAGKNLWLGTNSRGLSRCDQKDSGFRCFRARPGHPQSLAHSNVYAVYKDSRDNLWIGGQGGLTKYREKNHSYKHYRNEPGNPRSLSNNWVLSILEDSGGRLWVGTLEGINRFEPGTGTFTRYLPRKENARALIDNIILAAYEDPEGRLWIGTRGGLDKFDPTAETFTRYVHQPDNPKSLSHNYVTCILPGSGGNLWIGTQVRGLNRFDPKGGTFTRFMHQPGNPRSLSHDYVMSLLADSRGNLCIGTSGGGLNIFHPKTGTFSRYGKKDGLPNNVVYGILEDDDGYLWLSTNNGLAKFAPKRGTFFNYGAKDGLQGNEFNTGAFFKDKQGRMYFGGTAGLTAFFPRGIRGNTYVPPVALTGFLLFNKPVPVAQGDGPGKAFRLRRHISDTPEITLHYTDDIFAFEFSALNYRQPEKNRFKYKLENFDKDWVETGYLYRRATYTDLPDGRYVFRVKASNDDGVWNKTGTAVEVVILPPPWKTWWAYTLYTLAALALVSGFVHRQHKMVLQKQKELDREKEFSTLLEHKVRERTAELEKANETARKERQTADMANRSKSEFLAHMSHEIRTPMNGVIGFADMLLDTGLTDEQEDYTRTISRCGEALIALLNDILDFSKIEAGELTFETIDFDPEITVFDVCRLMTPRIGNKKIDLRCHIGNDVPAFIKTDPGRFRQVIFNLMGNAVKFTKQGVIEISLDIAKKQEQNIKLHVQVQDTGIGIAPEKSDAIFDAFQQADGSTTRKFGGTGLGLSICRQIARLMKGDVWAESEEGKGSTFHFTCWAQMSGKEPNKIAISLEGKKALIVDDHAAGPDPLSEVLTQHRMEVLRVRDPKRIVPVILEHYFAGKPFNIAVIDIRMPGLDAFEAAREIRAQAPPVAKLPLLAFAAFSPDYSIRIREAGYNGFLSRPIQRRKLLHIMKRLLGFGSGGEEELGMEVVTQHTIVEASKHSLHILLAEDNPVNIKLARYMLEKAGYTITIVTDGRDAVDTYSADPHMYDLILMDIRMPRMDGKEATLKIRELGFKDIPIIAMTAQAMKGDMESCLEAGMNDYIAKPISRERVFKVVEKWCLEK